MASIAKVFRPLQKVNYFYQKSFQLPGRSLSTCLNPTGNYKSSVRIVSQHTRQLSQACVDSLKSLEFVAVRYPLLLFSRSGCILIKIHIPSQFFLKILFMPTSIWPLYAILIVSVKNLCVLHLTVPFVTNI